MDEPVIRATARCARCPSVFMFDPETVPSIWCDVQTNTPHEPAPALVTAGLVERRPLCDECLPVVHAFADTGEPVSWPNGRPRPVIDR